MIRHFSYILIKPVMLLALANVFSQSYGQGHLVDSDKLIFRLDSMWSQWNVEHSRYSFYGLDFALKGAQKDRNLENELGHLGLRFNPINDQNVYLTYNYTHKKTRAEAQLGYSVNYFKAFSVSLKQPIALDALFK